MLDLQRTLQASIVQNLSLAVSTVSLQAPCKYPSWGYLGERSEERGAGIGTFFFGFKRT